MVKNQYQPLPQDEEEILNETPTPEFYYTSNDIESITDSVPAKHAKIFTRLDFMTLLLLLGANYLYIISNQRCPFGNETICAVKFIGPQFKQWGLQLAISAFVFIAVNYMGTRKILPRFWLIIANINVFYLIVLYNPVLTAFEYGFVIGGFLLIFMILWLAFLGFLIFLKKCWRKSRLLFVGLLLALICPGISFYFVRVRNSCAEWAKGLGGEEMTNDGETCSIETPKTCIYEITAGMFDLYNFGSRPNLEAQQATLEKYFSEAPVIGFPRTEKFSSEERLTPQQSIIQQTVPLKSMNDPAGKDLEVFLDMTVKGDPKINIEIKKNAALIKERARISSNSLVDNVLVVYIDALSRVNALRKLKKTMKWFEKYMNQQDSESETFQFFKYHAVAPHTYENLIESFYGVHENDPSLTSPNPPSSFIKEFQDSGFITAHSTDLCQLTPLEFNVPKVMDIPYDHEGLSMACDPNFFIPGNAIGLDHGPYSSMKQWLYKRDVFEYIYEYGGKFWNAYKNQKKFLYLEFLDAHEFTGEHVSHMDGTLSSFLEKLQNDGLLKNTAVILYADHGLHINIPMELFGFRQVEIEKYLPALFMRLPKEATKKYRSDIKANQQSMMSVHQLHNFFLTLAHGEMSPLLSDSLIGPSTKQRTCEDIRLKGECMCTLNGNKST